MAKKKCKCKKRGRKRAVGRPRKSGKKKTTKGKGHRKGHKGRGVMGFAALRAAQAAPAVAKSLGPYVMPVIGAAVARGLDDLLKKKKLGNGLRLLGTRR